MDFDDALFSISFQMTGDEDARIQDMRQISAVLPATKYIDKIDAMCNTNFTLLLDEMATYKYLK